VVPARLRRSHLSSLDAIVQARFKDLAGVQCAETRRVLTKEGLEGIYEVRIAESFNGPGLNMRIFSATDKSQAEHRARLHLHIPKDKSGKISPDFRNKQFELGLELQQKFPCEVSIVGNDLLVWTARRWNRSMKESVEGFEMVRRCFTELPIAANVAPVGQTTANADVIGVTHATEDDEITVWGKAYDGVPTLADWLEKAKLADARLEDNNPFMCRMTIKAATWHNMSNGALSVLDGWCRLTTVQPALYRPG
jgi:hypothetical protein